MGGLVVFVLMLLLIIAVIFVGGRKLKIPDEILYILVLIVLIMAMAGRVWL